jgi:hypothetical protein
MSQTRRLPWGPANDVQHITPGGRDWSAEIDRRLESDDDGGNLEVRIRIDAFGADERVCAMCPGGKELDVNVERVMDTIAGVAEVGGFERFKARSVVYHNHE